jgi:hypothetical protein
VSSINIALKWNKTFKNKKIKKKGWRERKKKTN